MGAPAVIAVPSKSYVAINSYKSDRSIPSSLCDLGRVSNIAAVVTLPRASDLITRNNVTHSVRSLPRKKRPIYEVMDSSNSHRESATTEIPTTNNSVTHNKRRYAIISELSTSSLATPSAVNTNLHRNHDSNSQAKEMKIKSTETSSNSATNIKKPYSVSQRQKSPNELNTQSSTSQSHSHPDRNQHGPNNPQLPNHYNMQMATPGMGQHPIQNFLPMQLHQQNLQLRNENIQLQKQLSLFRQLIKNPQRLNQVIARLEQRVQ